MALDISIQKKIQRLYQSEKLSVAQIATMIGLSFSGVSYYLDKFGIKRRSISEAITAVYITKFGKKPFKLRRNLSPDDQKLKVAGAMLYWGEGGKTRNSVNFTNSDPAMIKVFVKFLRRICGIQENRLKALLHAYPDQNIEDLLIGWSKITGIKRENFYKTHIHVGRKGTYKNQSKYGTLAIDYSDKLLLRTILGWIKECVEVFE